jgi:hypothetical protein
MNSGKSSGKLRWKYALLRKEMPAMKDGIPHSVWVTRVDQEAGTPVRGKNGNYVVRRTGGIAATMADMICAVKAQNVFMLHIIDAVEAVTGSNLPPMATTYPEGYVFASMDPVAVDVMSARYLFKTLPIVESGGINERKTRQEGFYQKVPVPKLDGQDIVTEDGFDSPMERYTAFAYWQRRSLGQQQYYVIGSDEWQGGSLVSISGHLGRIAEGKFTELITQNTYYAFGKVLWDLQKTAFAYLEANDHRSGSHYLQTVLSAFDENRDGIIDYSERGRKGFTDAALYRASHQLRMGVNGNSLQSLRNGFLVTAAGLRCSDGCWNPEGHDFAHEFALNSAVAIALGMSQSPAVNCDPLFPGTFWGKGKWPSIQYALYVSRCGYIYGAGFPGSINLLSLYGRAFRYAGLIWGEGRYDGMKEIIIGQEQDRVNRYVRAVRDGETPLPFILYVPPGYGSDGIGEIPNVKETADPALIFTAQFDNGKDIWRDVRFTDIP